MKATGQSLWHRWHFRNERTRVWIQWMIIKALLTENSTERTKIKKKRQGTADLKNELTFSPQSIWLTKRMVIKDTRQKVSKLFILLFVLIWSNVLQHWQSGSWCVCWRTEYNEVVVTCHRFERRQTLINQQWSKFFVATVQRDQMVRLFA